MSTLLLTLAIACIIVLLAVALLAIGWLLTGRTRLQPGACGRDPNKNRDSKECGTSAHCQLCDKPESKEDKPA